MLQTLTFAYNCTTHESTGYAPIYLMFGQIPHLPVDVMFHNVERDDKVTDYNSYVKRVKENLKEALATAQVNAHSSQQRQAHLYTLNAKGVNIFEGDNVLLANKGERGRRKLADKWSSNIYIVVSHDPRCHTYRTKDTATGLKRVVHHNLLLSANSLPLELDQEQGRMFSCNITPDPGTVNGDDQGVSVVHSGSDGWDRTADWVANTSSSNPEGPQEAESNGRNFQTEAMDAESLGESKKATRKCTDSPHNQPETDNEAVEIRPGWPPTDTESLVRSRAGRITKPVNRLIQNMTQKNTQTRNAVSEFAKSLFL